MSDKAIFLDRDDTLIEDPGYINTPEQVKLLDGVPEALVELKALGYKLVVATNQSAVARGIVTEKVLDEIHDRLKQLLARKKAFLDRIYYCPYHPDGVVPQYRKESNSRKPNPGMLQKAAEEMDLDLSQSWCIGNSNRDVEAGRRAGCRTILIDTPSHQKPSGASLSRVGGWSRS
ncbi:MAG: D-glycero-alpha-D-manno-heptose-1,7-bisphosphate 7-phosphatase [Planctomycetota bacterium]|jgi:D-glycero-D-manno-heptose 1,7-bisphosphate phosphatase